MSIDTNIKCSKIEEIKTGSFREPELCISVEDMDLNLFIKEVGEDTILEEIQISDIINFLENRGYTITEDEV